MQYCTETLAGVPKLILSKTVKIAALSNRGIEREMSFPEMRMKRIKKKKKFHPQNSCLVSD